MFGCGWCEADGSCQKMNSMNCSGAHLGKGIMFSPFGCPGYNHSGNALEGSEPTKEAPKVEDEDASESESESEAAATGGEKPAPVFDDSRLTDMEARAQDLQ